MLGRPAIIVIVMIVIVIMIVCVVKYSRCSSRDKTISSRSDSPSRCRSAWMLSCRSQTTLNADTPGPSPSAFTDIRYSTPTTSISHIPNYCVIYQRTVSNLSHYLRFIISQYPSDGCPGNQTINPLITVDPSLSRAIDPYHIQDI